MEHEEILNENANYDKIFIRSVCRRESLCLAVYTLKILP